MLMLAPLVIPGVILGISDPRVCQPAGAVRRRSAWGLELDFLRPGLPLVVIGQFSYIVSIATLIITARLKRFDITLEEAAYNLGASRAAVFGPSPCPT
jgi:spermidine/putrescine transport system permease protein